MNHQKKIAKVCILLLFFCSSVFAEKTAVKNLYHYTLKNGLELFVAEDNTTPLAYIEIAVRAGGVTQTPETAGLFHLYEHMMFKGNAKYENQAEVQSALTNMGVSNWNGSTGIDRVNYYFTIPSNLLREGLEFWSYAIRTPKIDEQELENEKGVVLSEIGADVSDPAHILTAALATNLFAESPWQLDPSGMPQTIEQATAAQLREIQAQYYVPNNAALFIGGNVHHKTVYKLAKKIYGDWKPGKAVPKVTPPTTAPFGNSDEQTLHRFVYADPRTSGSYIHAEVFFRGPDGENAAEDTFAADAWSGIISNPNGYFANSLSQDDALHIPDPAYTGGSYLTRRAAGIISISATMLQAGQPVQQTEHFFKQIASFCSSGFSDTESFLTEEAISAAKKQKNDADIYAQETAAGILSSISFMWAACGSDYFFTYDSAFKQTTAGDIQAFVAKYLQHAQGMAVVVVSPQLYTEQKAAFDAANYKLITAENAFWWR